MGKKVALVTGITGQDGSYLAELLLSKDYVVHGIIRRSSSFNTDRIDHVYNHADLHLHYGDLSDGTAVSKLIKKIMPDEIYNLGAQSHVRVSFDQPVYTVDVDALGVLRLLEVIRELRQEKQIKFYQASSSEMFGSAPPPQNEDTPFHPRSPYGCAKVYSYWQTVNYREAYDLFACNGILFNHEGPRRGETFVTRKITRAATRIKLELQDKLYLGNLDARRDWGSSQDYVEAMWMMLQHDKPGDYVVATGEAYSVKEFVEEVFDYLDLNWEDHIEIDPRYFRPSEVDVLLGDPSKAKKVLGWEPKTSFKELVMQMVDSDMEIAKREKIIEDAK